MEREGACLCGRRVEFEFWIGLVGMRVLSRWKENYKERCGV